MKAEIRISGFGGQGVVLAGYILGKAVALYEEGMEAVMTQSYGPEARGGASSSEVVIADHPIDFPFVRTADVLIALSQEGYNRFRTDTVPGATVIIDEGLVTPSKGDRLHGIPATRMAEDLGRRIVANVVMLGYFTAITGLVKRESMEKAIETTVRPKTLPLNLRAYALGYEFTPSAEVAR